MSRGRQCNELRSKLTLGRIGLTDVQLVDQVYPADARLDRWPILHERHVGAQLVQPEHEVGLVQLVAGAGQVEGHLAQDKAQQRVDRVARRDVVVEPWHVQRSPPDLLLLVRVVRRGEVLL